MRYIAQAIDVATLHSTEGNDVIHWVAGRESDERSVGTPKRRISERKEKQKESDSTKLLLRGASAGGTATR